ncbi:MAG: ribosome-recycling factor, partial [Deltaproteobacteria bacterium]|nr:ribosome-recycling factor [Deltaproteobacteria bacterium]
AADDADRAKKKIEELVAQGNQVVEQLVASKEKDILEV